MDANELVQRASCPVLPSSARPERPEPFVIPAVSAVSVGRDDPLVMIDAPAAVGKSTFASWLANEANAHFIDLGALNVGSHGFVGNLAAKGLQQTFDRGELTVVIDSLDEGLVRSGFANYEAFFTDVAEVLNSAKVAWSSGIVRLVLLGRSDSVDLTGLILEAAGAEFMKIELEVGQCDSSVQSVARRPGASLRVSAALFRHPWSSVAEKLPERTEPEAQMGAVEKLLASVAGVLPDAGRPAFLDGSGRPLADDANFTSWSSSEREALGALIRQFQAAGIVTKTNQPTHGPVPTFSYRPEGFRWEDLGGIASLDVPPWNTVDWSRVARFL